jgi:predicted ABC-type transport system involved in lysophospholipase L1 biosynthesis ATPase subunit
VRQTRGLARLGPAPGQMVSYLGSAFSSHDESAVPRGPSAGGGPAPAPVSGPGAVLDLTDVACGSADAPRDAPGVNLHVPGGQCVALICRPAAAASDLIDTVAGLRRPTAGQVSVDGVQVHKLRGHDMDRYRGDRGLVSMRFPLLGSLSVTDNVLVTLQSRRADSAARDRAARLLAFAGSAQSAGEPVETLTADLQWRILIARALMPSPRLVLAEDPAPSLDPDSAITILDLLLHAHAVFGFTLLLSSGSVATASRCQRLVRVAGGAVVEDVLIGGDDGWTRGRVDRIG